jgi:hypothetical protein
MMHLRMFDLATAALAEVRCTESECDACALACLHVADTTHH